MNIVPKRANMERRRGAMDRGRVESLVAPPRPRLRPPAGSLGHGEADLAARYGEEGSISTPRERFAAAGPRIAFITRALHFLF